MNAYATPVLLGGTGLTMMAPAVYDQIAKTANWPFGAALALILMTVTLVGALASSLQQAGGYAAMFTVVLNAETPEQFVMSAPSVVFALGRLVFGLSRAADGLAAESAAAGATAHP